MNDVTWNWTPWFFLFSAIPVLLLGEFLVRRINVLGRFNIPAPVVGGLLVSLLVLAGNLLGLITIDLSTKTAARWWTWFVTTHAQWQTTPSLDVHRPFLVGFFTCIGLNASWDLVRRGGLMVLVFLTLTAAFSVVQNLIGIGMAGALGVSPLLGLMCGSVSMTGGHATSLGFAGEIEAAGLEGAAVIGTAAATFGLVMGGLVGGPLGGALIRKRKLKSSAPAQTHLEAGQTGEPGILRDMRTLSGYGTTFLLHLLLLVTCVKLGAWVSDYIQAIRVEFKGQEVKLTFPVYMGSMLLGVAIRNVLDLSGRRWIRTEVIDTLSSVMLGLFLAIAMMGLNLRELAHVAGPMLVILPVQVVVMLLFARAITFWVMGRDFDAAVMAGGHCGFGLGATPTAVANMKSLVERFGPAPRAFLVLPVVGAFLNDFPNAINIIFFLNVLKPAAVPGL